MSTLTAPSGRRTPILRRGPVLAALLVVGFLVGFTPAAAIAGTASSPVGTYTVFGYGYQNQAVIVTLASSSGSASARTNVSPQSGCAPAGYMGARARLFNSAGSLVQESSTQYNSGCSTGLIIPTNRTGHGTWYSYGVTYGYNGGGYSPYYTFQSPNQTS